MQPTDDLFVMIRAPGRPGRSLWRSGTLLAVALAGAVQPASGQPTVELEPPPSAAGSPLVVEVEEIGAASNLAIRGRSRPSARSARSQDEIYHGLLAGPTGSRVEPAVLPVNTTEIASDLRGAIITLVSGWSQAWARQQTEEYLGYYSEEFQLPGPTDRATWEHGRRQRLERPQFVEVAVAILDAELMHNDRAKVRFLQRYRSDVYQDVVTKTLELVTEEGGWKILREIVEDQP